MARILVIEDEVDLCEILQFNLEQDGHQVDIAHSAEAAMKMDISSYDLLLLDVMLGGISGFRLASILRENPPPLIYYYLHYCGVRVPMWSEVWAA